MHTSIAFSVGHSLLGFLLLVQPALAQERPEALFRDTVSVEIVNIEVFVTDKQGEPVSGLEKSDFRLLVDGRETPITNFYAEVAGTPVAVAQPLAEAEDTMTPPEGDQVLIEPAEQKLHLMVFVDCTQSLPHNRPKVFDELESFLESMLSPGDVVSVLSYDQALKVRTGFTSDHTALQEILNEVEKISTDVTSHLEYKEIFSEISSANPDSFGRSLEATRLGISLGNSLLNRIRAYAQVCYQRNLNSIRALQSAVRTLAEVNGRKALVHVSDGIATNPGEDLWELWKEGFGDKGTYQRNIGSFDLLPEIEALGRIANAGRVTIYAIDSEPDHRAIRGSVERSSASVRLSGRTLAVMESIVREPIETAAKETGGQRFQSSWRLDQDLLKMATDLSTCYSLGFKYQRPDRDSSHRIEVRLVDGKDLRVRHRESFGTDSRTDDQRFSGEVIAAALLDETSNSLEAELDLRELPRQMADGSSVLPAKVLLPIKNLLLLPGNDCYEARLSFFVTVKSNDGETRPVQKLSTRLRVPANELEQARSTFAIYDVPVVIHGGDQRAVIGIRDDGAATTSTVAVDLLSQWTQEQEQAATES